ncbi:MAG TPA: ABC transporter permease [Thermomicrobiaceae bacterium]|nr:ABC transporter permease [Thermomicrobiaceae bacterium]
MADEKSVERLVNATGAAELPVAEQRLDHLAGQRSIEGSRFWRRIRSEKKAFLGLIFVVLLAFISIAGPLLAPYGADDVSFDQLAAPSLHHPMGTDSFGHDLLSRVILGTRISFSIGIIGALVSMIAGVAAGIVAGYYLGWIDNLIMRIVDLIWAFPAIVLAMGLVSIYGAGAKNIIIAIAISNMVAFARIVRGDVLSLRESDFAVAARAIGVRDGRIMLRHLLPNVAAPIIVQMTLVVGFGILTETGLTFLGLGVNPATPTWGQALNDSRNFIHQAWWLAVFPGLAIGFTVLSMNLLGDGLRDALDVRNVSEV